MKKPLITLFLMFFISFVSFGQKLKLRLEPGFYLPLTTGRAPFWHPEPAIYLPNEYFYFERNWKNPNPFHMNGLFGIALGYETRNKTQFDLGIHGGEGPMYNLIWRWQDLFYTDPVSGIDILADNIHGLWYSLDATKIRGTVSLPLNKLSENQRGFQMNYTIGASWMWIHKGSREDYLYEYRPTETYYPDTTFIISFDERVLRFHTVLFHTGFQVSYFSQKREWASLKFFYEQGLFIIGGLYYDVTRNKTSIGGGVFSRGSAFHLKLSVPIDLYTFNKPQKGS